MTWQRNQRNMEEALSENNISSKTTITLSTKINIVIKY